MTKRIVRGLYGAWAGAVLLGVAAVAAEPRIHYPAKTELTYEAVAARPPDTANASVDIWTRGVVRGYDAVGFAVDPADPSKGSRWLCYDTGQRKVTTLREDTNDLVGQKPQAGVPGQRLSVARQIFTGRQSTSVYGTAAAPGKGEYPGGHVIRDGRDMGAVAAGWSVVDIDPDFIGAVKVGAETYPDACLALAASADGAAYRFYVVPAPPPQPRGRRGAAPAPQAEVKKIVPLGVEGGQELMGFCVAGGELFYRAADGAILRKTLKSDAAPEPVPAATAEALGLMTSPGCHRLGPDGLEVRFLLAPGGDLVRLERDRAPGGRMVAGRIEGVAAGVAANQIDAWSVADSWTRQLNPNENPEIVEAGGLKEGFIVFARPAAKAGEAARLVCLRPALNETTDLGPLAPFDGQALGQVHRLSVLPWGDVLVLAGNEKVTVLQIYQSPIMDTACAQLQAVLDKAGRADGEPRVKVHFVKSLYEFAENADRTFGSMMAASDGRFYFGVMPHHPTVGSPVFRYEPKTGELRHFGEFDALAGAKGPGLIPCMMHAPPVEIDGRLYFTGQDPFYGGHDFPGMTPQNTRYAGSPLLMYEMKTERWTPLGIPIPSDNPDLALVMGGKSVFHMAGDAKRRDLYLRPGYSTGDWWVVRLAPDGKLAGAPVKAAFKGWTPSLHVAEDGMIYYPLVRTEKSAEDGPAGPPCDIWRFNPDTKTNGRVTTFDVLKLTGAPAPPRGGQVSNACSWAEARQPAGQVLLMSHSPAVVMRFDIASGQVVKCGAWPPGRLGAVGFYGDKAYSFVRSGGRGRAFDTVTADVMDLKTGEITTLGKVVDDRGRWFYQVTDVCFNDEGKMCLSAEIWGAPGDPYNRRYRPGRPGRMDSCLWVVDKPEDVGKP